MAKKTTAKELPAGEIYQEITLADTDKPLLLTLDSLGVELDHARVDVKGNLQLAITSTDLLKLEANNIGYDIIHEDLAAFYASRLDNEYVSRDFELGSMGGYYTFDEIEQHLSFLKQENPDIFHLEAIGQSEQGRNIWMVRISDDADTDEDEPEALYTGLHHAREPMSYMNLFYYMDWLVDNYEDVNSDDYELAQYLVNNRELYFVPAVNPDGLVYNESISSNGGGMQRKNMKETCNGSDADGVDLNRNYDYLWNCQAEPDQPADHDANACDPNGSSGSPCNQTYRGTSSFSELETQTIRDFIEGHDFKIALNYHSYGSLLIHPNVSQDHPDFLIYEEYGNAMTQYNNYFLGTDIETVGYTVNGDSDTWMYFSEGIITYTPEIGSSSDGFWPATNRIIPLAEENLFPNIFVARAVGSMLDVKISNSEICYLPGQDYTLELTIFNSGLSSANGPFNLTINSLVNNIDLNTDTTSLENSITIAITDISKLDSRDEYTFQHSIRLADAPINTITLALDFLVQYGSVTDSGCFGECGQVNDNPDNDCSPLLCTGDTNADGEVNILDIINIVNLTLENTTATNGDVNNDGQTNIQDITATVVIILNDTNDCNPANCAANFTLGCNNTDYCYSDTLLNNGTCEEALNCQETGWDDGDCPYCGDNICSTDETIENCPQDCACASGYITDCDDSGEYWPESWVGDGYPDCEDQPYDADLTCYDNDGGDCLLDRETEDNCNTDDFLI